MANLRTITLFIVLSTFHNLILADSKLLRLRPGTSYEYSYSGRTQTLLAPHSSRPEDHDLASGLFLNATVTVTALSPCEIQLDMSEVSLSGGGGSAYVTELSREPVRASLQAGRVETLCVSETTAPLQRWALNVKRGVLSALQLSLRSAPDVTGSFTVHESDVSGTCRTQYEYLQMDKTTLVTRKKDLALCSGRSGYGDVTRPLTLDPSATLSSRPLLRGEQECLQTIREGRVTLARCSERHVFQPFSNGDNGAHTYVEQVFVLEKEIEGKQKKLKPLPTSHRRTSLMYEHEDAEFKDVEPQLDTQRAEEAMALTLALLDEIAPYRQALEVQRDTAGKFGRLVRLMRQLPHQYLYNLATLNPQSDAARDLVMDALPVLDTSAATTTMATLYAAREEQVPRLRQWLEQRAAPWFASLAYSRRPTSEMLNGALVLLREYEEGRLPHGDGTGIVLGLTGLAHALCEKLGGTSKCAENRVIHATVAALERIAAGDDERARIVAIKGLSNIGVFHNGEKLLQSYYQSSSASMELRLTAMDAFRRAPCPNPMTPSPLLNVYMDTTQDSEARIAAYLAAVRCPTAALMRAVKRTLYSETVNQVGSFVWTHLTNSQESRSKSRQPLRALIANEFLQNKFRTDARQFSRNFEVSRYFESLGIGATADSNVIFSTKSYLPRSAMLNMTIDLFGESVNLLEIGGRAEGLEPFVERLFSREGLLSNEPLAEMLRNSRSDPTLDAARNLTNPLKQVVTPKASTYVRLFGNEISYKELEDILDSSHKFDVNPSIILKALINRNEHKFSRSFELVDVTQEVPTAIGLPLKLSVNGSASVNIAMTGNMESKKTGVQVSGKFAPSANIAMTGKMAVGNDDFKQGIKFEAMMYTHTTLESRLKISFDGKLNFQSEMPNEKQTLIEITSERFIFNGDKVSRLPDLTPDRETFVECTGEFADKLFGVKICSEISYPNASLVETAPYFPLSGDSHVNITIVKTDPTFKTYDFSTSWSYVPGKKYDFGISYDRLGSSMENRRRVVQAVFDRNAGVARVTLDLPEKQAEVAVNWDSKELSAADLVVTYDRVTIADVFAKMTHQPKVLPGATIATAGKYEPELKFKVKGLPEFTIAGVVNYVANQKVSTELRLVGLTERTLTLAADYARDAPSGAVDARISVDTPWIAWDVKGGAKLTSNSLGLRVGGVYNVSADEQHNIDLLAKYNWNVQGALRRDYLNLRAQMSQWPRLSGQVMGEVMTSRGYYEASARATLADETWNVTQRAQSSGGGDVWLSTKVQCPQRDVDFQAEHRHKLKENSFTVSTRLHVDTSRQVKFHLDCKRIPGDGVSFTTNSSLLWPGITFSDGTGPYLESRLHQTIPGHYVAYLATRWTNDNTLKLNATYINRSSLKALKHTVDAQLTGALGFTEDSPLTLVAKLQAESGKAHANASLAFGSEEQVRIMATYELEMQERHKFNFSTLLWNTKKYEFIGVVVNTESEKNLALDIIMSRHIALDIKVSDRKVSSEIYWNKAKHPEHNVTLTVDMDKSNGIDFNATLLFPQQRIEMDGKWAIIPRGYEAKGRIEWQPSRKITAEAMFRGSPKEGILTSCEVVTKGVPVLGDSRRRVIAEFTSGTPATVRASTVSASYSWGADLENNVECEANYRRQHYRTVLNLQATSSLWHGKEAKVHLTSTGKGWTTFSGEMSGKWGSEGVALHWEAGSTMRLGMQSSWSRLPSCGVELRTDVRDEATPLVTKHSLKVYHEDDSWEGVLSLRRHSLETQKLESVQLDVMTPLEEYRAHTVNLTWKGSYPRSMEVAARITTPLVGDYGFSGHWAMTSQFDAGLHVLNADITVLKLDMTLHRNAWQSNSAQVTLLIPEVCNVETLLSFVKNSTAFDAQFQFKNNKKLLHEFALDFHREHFDDKSVSVGASFSGYSYVILTSKWDVEMKHAGTVNKHMSYVRINQFILDHHFDFTDYGEWNFYLIGKTTNSDLLNITMLHEDGSRLFYYLNAMDKEVVHLRADMDQGYANLNLMDNAFQIHSKFTNDDEVITYSKILSDLRIIAEVSTSSYLKYDEQNVLESMIISGNIKSDSDFATLKINMAAGRQVIGSLNIIYAQHQANIEVDLLSMNNSVTLNYGVAKEVIVEFQGFLYFSGAGGNAGLTARYREHNFWLKGDVTLNDDESISVKATADGSFDTNSFPMTLTAKIMIPQMRLDLKMLDKNQAGVSISTQLNLQPNTKSLMFKFDLPGYNDEFINFDIKYDTARGKSLVFTYEKKRFRYHGEFAMTDNLITAHLQTPLDGYRRVSLRLGVMDELPLRAVLEFAKEEFMFDSEILFTDGDNSQVILIAKSSEGMQLESVFNKIRSDRFTDCLLVVDLNGDKMQAGALMEYTAGNLNITTNVTRGEQTARMSADIRRTEQTKSFAISSEYRGRTYRLHIYSAAQDTRSSYEQGFKVQTPSFSSEFKYEKSAHRSLAYLKFQNQVIHCTLDGTVKKGDLVISQTTEKSLSNLRLVFDFEDKIDATLTAMLNEQLRANIPVTIANANPLFVKAVYNPKAGKAHFYLKYKTNNYLADGSYLEGSDRSKVDIALETPFFEKTCMNISYKFSDNQKIMAIHFDYGADYYDIFSEVSIDGTSAVHINLDIKSSLPNFERITLLGGFKNDVDFRASVKLDLQNNFYVVSINSVPGKSFRASLETSDKEVELGYENIDDLHKILFSIDKRDIINAGFKLVDTTLYGTVITPYEKYRNMTLYVGYGSNITRKSVEIHRNDELLFKAHVYPVDDLDLQSGTGIMATFYQGDEKLVYDAQFSINNPVYVILKQHETINGTRDILHFNLNVTDEYTASGEAVILLPIAPHTKILAKGYIQIENNNAEFRVSYKIDEEKESNFSINYQTFTNEYNIYNIITTISTPFKGYESMSLKIQSSLTETIVNFVSPFSGYENIKIISVHRLDGGNKKELQVQYQNMDKRIFYLKALFNNEPTNKLVDLEARSPFLNGQVLVYSNGSVMGIKLEHNRVILIEIVSKFQQLNHGHEYQFLFQKPEKRFELSTRFHKESKTEFRFNTAVDNKALMNIDFVMTPSGHIVSKVFCPNGKEYSMSGDLDWSENSLQLSITGDNFKTIINFAIKTAGHINVESSMLQNTFGVSWNISQNVANLYLKYGRALDVKYDVTDSSVLVYLSRNDHVYSFSFGKSQGKEWDNIKLQLTWNSEQVIDFQHQFSTDSHLSIKTKLVSPVLGTYKTMKFEVILKTKDILSVEAEFKWRPKDLTTFKSQLKLDTMKSQAQIDFKSPFTSEFKFRANYEFATDVKTMEVFYQLSEIVHLKVTIIPNGPEQKINITLISPIQGYKHISLVGVHTYSRKQHIANLKFKRETSSHEINIVVDSKELKAILSSGNVRWILTGNYDLNESVHSVLGAFQWGGAADVIKAELVYKPSSRLLLNIDGPNTNYKIDSKTEWSNEKKALDLLLKRDETTVELNFQLAIRDNLYMLVGFIKSPFIDFIRVSSILDTTSQELRGALQLNETVYSIQAIRIDDSKYNIALLTDDIERMQFEVSFGGEIKEGLKIEVVCTTPERNKVKIDGILTFTDVKKSIAFDVSWGENFDEIIAFSYQNNEYGSTVIQSKINTVKMNDFEGYVNYGSNFISLILRNQSETFKGRVDYQLNSVYSLNSTVDYNHQNFVILSYFDPNDINAYLDVSWPKNQKVKLAIILRPGELFFSIATPFVHFSNIQVSGKYSEYLSNNLYEISSSATAQYDEYTVSLEGSVRNLKENYGVTGTLKWGNEDSIMLSCDVLQNRTLIFDLRTPFKGLPHINAKFEALKYRHVVTGIRGEIQSPFMKLPQLKFLFNNYDNVVDAQFSFDTSTYKNISIQTKFSTNSYKQLFVHLNTPFINQVKQIRIDAKTEKINRRGYNTKIFVHMDQSVYEARSNYTINNGKLDTSVYLKGPNSQPIAFTFGGKFIMNTFSKIDVESYFNEDIVALKYDLSQNAIMTGKIYLPTTELWTSPTIFDLTVIRDGHFEGKLNYNHSGIVGNALVRNKLTDSALETIMYLNLPRILKYPLQLELNANYIKPRLQFSGYASFMAEHRLDLTMTQSSFRTTLDAHLNSAFFKGTKKFSLSLTSGTLSVSMNDEIRVTGIKKPNQLVLTLSQLLKQQDHTLTYNWELMRIPKFEVTLESPILAAKKATFSATYLGLTQGVNLKLVSGTETMQLDYGLINQHNSKGIKVVVGNANTQILNFAATLVKISHGHEIIADLHVLDLNYKGKLNYTLPMAKDNPLLTASLKLQTPYLLPMKILNADLKAGRENNNYVLAANVLFDEENIKIDSILNSDSLIVQLNSTFDYIASSILHANYKHVDDKHVIDATLIANNMELISANSTLIRRPHSVILECYSKAKIEGFEEFRLKLTIPSELKYSLTANVELLTTEPFKAYFILTSRPEYTNLDLVMTGLSANIHLTSNQGDFSYKSGSDDYHMRIYSKSSGHELHSELTVNSGSIELFKAGLFGMYHNNTDFYILMSTTSVYEPVQNVVFYVGAEKSQLRFGAEYEGNMEPSKQSYTATINHHVVSLTDFDLGLTVENSGHETFTAKLTHTLKPDFYVALAQINKAIIKITKINQDQVILGTATAKLCNFATEMSLKLTLHEKSKGVDVKLTHENIIYQIGGLYNYSTDFIKASFDIDSPYTSQNSIILELAQPDVLYLAVDRNHSALIMIEFHPQKSRSKYVLLNFTDTKFMLDEYYENSKYELTASALIQESLYTGQYELTRDTAKPGSYKCNVTLTLPTRKVNLYRDQVKSANRNLSQVYFSWENMDKRVGYSYESYKDNFKTNLIASVEIPNRALQLKTHKKYATVDDMTEIEYGVQFNWNAKVHTTPVTMITAVKHNSHAGYVYVVFAHPSFNSSFVIDGEVRRLSSRETHFASKIGTVKNGVMNHLLSTALNITGDETTQQYRVQLLHSESGLDHVWTLNTDVARGFYAKLTLDDGASNKYATGVVNYIADYNHVDVSVSCQDLEMNLAGEVEYEGRYGVMLMGSYDPLNDPVSVSVNFERTDSETSRLIAELSLAKDRSYNAEARYSPMAMSARLVHREYSTSMTAIQAYLTLNDTKTLSVRGRYRPEIWNNITHDLMVPYERASLVAEQLTTGLRGMFREEILQRLSNASGSAALANVYRRVMEDTKAQWAGLRQDLATVRLLAAQIYQRDDFYVRTIYEYTVGALSQGRQMLNAGWTAVQEALRSFFTRLLPELLSVVYRSTIEPLVQGLQRFAPSFARFVRKLTDAWRTVQSAVSSAYKTTVTYARDAAIKTTKYATDNMVAMTNWATEATELVMDEFVSPWMESLAELASEIESWFSQVNAYISALPVLIEEYFLSLEETKAIITIYKQYANWLEELRFAETVTSLRDALRSWYAGLVNDMKDHLGEHAHYVIIVLDAMKGSYDEVMNLPPVIYLRMVHARVNQKISWMWNYWELEKTLGHIIISISDHVIQMLIDWADEAVMDYRQNSVFSDADKNYEVKYEALTGDFAATVALPFKWRRFDQTPELDGQLDEKFENFRYAVMDRMYHMATEYSDWMDTAYRTLLPPFSSSALVTVNGHIITFDGHHYKVKDQLCGTYLLAADYHDHKFAIMVNYGGQEANSPGPLKSLTLFTKSGHRFDLTLDVEARERNDEDGFSKVTIDMNKVELPVNAGGFSVQRDGQMVVANGEGGVVLRCNVVAGLCSLELPGWFHGRVAGIAGSLDRELGNDVITPQGDSPTSISDFLKQWRLNQGPQCSVPAITTSKPKGRVRGSSVCRRLFRNTDSPMQPCFKRLDPDPFRMMCDQDAAGYTQNRATGDVDDTRGPECLAAEAYVEQCKFVGMEISMPSNCVQCRLPNGRILGAGEIVIYDSAPNSTLPSPPAFADVVFLIERPRQGAADTCLQARDLAELPAKLESVLRASHGINNTRFAILSFGAGQDATVHTQEGLIWGGRRSLQQALTNLQVESTPKKATDRDLLSALLVAASKLPYRAGASKTIILAPCVSCARTDETAAVFAEASSLLLEADMKLHVLQRDEMPFRRGKKRQSVNQGSVNPVMGVDSHGAYTGRRIKGTSIPLPSKAIMRQLSIPKDLCTPLAMETNGTLFSAARLLRRSDSDQRPQQQSGDVKRKFLDVWSRRVASSAKPTSCQTCDCLPYTDGSSRITCQPCVSPSIQYFLQEWEDFLEAAALEDVVEDGDDEGPTDSEEVAEAFNMAARVQEETEAERAVLNRIRDMLAHGRSLPQGI